MPPLSKRNPKKRPSGESRTPVHIDAGVYDGIRKLAVADERTVTRYVNRVLQEHLDSCTHR